MFVSFSCFDAVSSVSGCGSGTPDAIGGASEDLSHEAVGDQRGQGQVEVLVILIVDSHVLMVLCLLWSCLMLSISNSRYFLRKLKKVKKSNGQVLAINEVVLVMIWHLFSICYHSCIIINQPLCFEYLQLTIYLALYKLLIYFTNPMRWNLFLDCFVSFITATFIVKWNNVELSIYILCLRSWLFLFLD